MSLKPRTESSNTHQKTTKTTAKQKNNPAFTKSDATSTYRSVQPVTWTTNRSESISP